jgi:protein-S-isoprenylcysteine O-methyltransferase Ste14
MAQSTRGARARAALGSAAFFVAAPFIVGGYIPWKLTGWTVDYASGAWIPIQIIGAVIAFGGAVALVSAFVRFVVEGLGTPAPVAPTEYLVIGGLYRYVRNPMYLAVGATILGQALLFGSLESVFYLGVYAACVVAFVHGYEEPTLLRSFGDEYEAYRRAVPGWWPRRRPWTPPRHAGTKA